MFNMSDLSVELLSTEKSYTFPLSNTTLYSIASNVSNMLH